MKLSYKLNAPTVFIEPLSDQAIWNFKVKVNPSINFEKDEEILVNLSSSALLEFCNSFHERQVIIILKPILAELDGKMPLLTFIKLK